MQALANIDIDYCKQDALSLEKYSVVKDRQIRLKIRIHLSRLYWAGVLSRSTFKKNFIATHDSSAKKKRQSLKKQRTWWSWTGSNRRPQACKARALPAELQPPSPLRSEYSNRTRSVVQENLS